MTLASSLQVTPRKISVFYFSLISHLIITFHPSLNIVFLQLRDFRRIRPLMSKTAAITLANPLIHSRLNYWNSLFYGFPNYSIHRLQNVNTAARIVIRSVRLTHITPIPKFLHWLCVNSCINFKICCITHRALS